MKTITPAILFAALLATPACSPSSNVDCAELASHEAELLVDMLPTDMRPTARARIADQRAAIERRCDEDPPAEATARCQLAAADIRAHRLCGRTQGED